MSDTALAAYLALQAGHLPKHKLINGVVDAFMDQSGVDLTNSVNHLYDTPRSGFAPTRSQAETIVVDNFDTLTGWTKSCTGSGSAAIFYNTDPVDPALNGNALKLATGGTLGSVARVQKDIGSVPASFSIGFQSRMSVNLMAGSDAFHVDLQNVNNKELKIRQRYNAFEIFQDGAWQLCITHPRHNLFMEAWVEAIDQGDGTHRVQVLLGTQIIFDRIGYLPGSTGINGLLVIYQESGANNNRVTDLSYVHIGPSQKADNLTLTSNPVTAEFVPTAANLLLLIEDVSVSVDINNNVIGEVSNDNGATWEAVTMARKGTFCPGEIDPPKNTDIFTGTLTFAVSGGTAMRWRIRATGNNWNFMQGVYLGWS